MVQANHFVPFQKSYNEGSGLMFSSYVENGTTKYSGIDLGKVIPINRNNNFSIMFKYMLDSPGSWSDLGYRVPIFSIGNLVLCESGSKWRLIKSTGNKQLFAAMPTYPAVHAGLYETVCITISGDSIPTCTLYKGDDVISKQISQPESWDVNVLSEGNCKVGFGSIVVGGVNASIFISDIKVYDKCLSLEEYLSIMNGFGV